MTQGLVYGYSQDHWAETHFDQSYSRIRGSGRLYLGFDSNWSRPSDMDSRKPAFMSLTLRPALPQEAVFPGSIPLWMS